MRLALAIALMALLAAAAPAKKAKPAKKDPEKATEIWAHTFKDASPVAAFFDASSGRIFVSLREKSGGRVDRLALDGALEKEGIARGKGQPGPLRAFDGRIYWISGDSVRAFRENEEVEVGKVPGESGGAVDIAVGRRGQVYLGLANGSVYLLQEPAGSTLLKGGPVTGLFLLEHTLHILRGTRLQSVELSAKGEGEARAFCSTSCTGLERTSGGDWLTVQSGKVLELGSVSGVGSQRSRVLQNPGKEIGRPAYVYRKEPKDDFYLLPFPAEGVLRAYRMPEALK